MYTLLWKKLNILGNTSYTGEGTAKTHNIKLILCLECSFTVISVELLPTAFVSMVSCPTIHSHGNSPRKFLVCVLSFSKVGEITNESFVLFSILEESYFTVS